jgi:hypothetical protein
MAFVQRRNSCPITRLRTYGNLGISRTRVSIDGSDILYASYMNCCSNLPFIITSSSQSSRSSTFYDAVSNLESDTVPFPEFDEQRTTNIIEQMKEIEFTQQASGKLSLWDVIRTKVSASFKLQNYSINPFRDNCSGRKSKNDARIFDNLHLRGGYLELSASSLEDSTEIEYLHRTQQASWQAHIRASRSQANPLTQVQVKLTTLKRSGAIRGRKPRVGFRTTNKIHDSRVAHACLNSSEPRTSRSNGKSSTNARTTNQVVPPKTKKSNLRDEQAPLLVKAPKRVRFAPSVQVVLEHKACEACEHRTQSTPVAERYNDEDSSALVSTSTPELEDLSWTKAPSGIRFLSTETTRLLIESESYAVRTMGPILKRNMICFAWGEFAEARSLRWLDGFLVGEVRAGLDVDCSWLSGG